MATPCFLISRCPLFEYLWSFPINDVSLTFELLYLHTGCEDLFDDDKQKTLVETNFAHTHTPTLAELDHVLSFIMHGIALSSDNSVALKAHIVLLARFFETTKAFSETYFEALKEIVFIHPNSFKDVLFSAIPGDILEGKFLTFSLFIELDIVF